MRTPPKDLAHFNANFIWTQDSRLDSWRLLRAGSDGKFRGDCDDYAVTVAYLESGSSWLRFWWRTVTRQKVFWYCRTKEGESHMHLWVWGKGWIDNINPSFGLRRFKFLFPAPVFVVVMKMLLGAAQNVTRRRS
jgi:hypothetical protein